MARSARSPARPRKPFADSGRHLVGGEAEEFLNVLERRGLAVAVDADRESTLADETMPVVGAAGLERDAPGVGGQSALAPPPIFGEEALGRGHAHDANRHAVGLELLRGIDREAHLGAGRDQADRAGYLRFANHVAA